MSTSKEQHLGEVVGEKRTGYLELFFDLVFVFAVTQLVTMLHADHHRGGWMHAFLVAWLVWWAWSQFTWSGNAIDLDRRRTRVAILGVTALTLLFAAAMPHAFTAHGGLRFAVPYTLVRLSGLALYWLGVRTHEVLRAALRSYLPVAVVSPLVVLVGGACPATARPWIWLVALGIDIASALAAGRGEFGVAPGHFAERYALIVIIALGESIVGVGATVAGLALTPVVLVTTLAAFMVVASQWWGYFDWFQEAAERRLASEPDLRKRGQLARDLFTFGHFPIVLGSVVFALGVEEAVASPSVRLDATGLVAVGVGLVLFLVGFIASNGRATHTLLTERTLALVAVVVVVVFAGPHLAAANLLVVLAVILLTLSGVESIRRGPRAHNEVE
jgi:low temperature requirement protein LtrA